MNQIARRIAQHAGDVLALASFRQRWPYTAAGADNSRYGVAGAATIILDQCRPAVRMAAGGLPCRL
ncbi:MAG TPA: hypothetical protein VKB53_04525 [Gammaproteobacteria bacterium]|nr:hypothetical protein [Gammaproteobacteria bacterium]